MIVEDFVMLGKTIPEPNSDGRVFVCSAGLSVELQSLLRIYPLARSGCPRRWSISSVTLERNPQDSRIESWRLKGDRSTEHHPAINNVFSVHGNVERPERDGLLARFEVSSINQMNGERRSLAIIRPLGPPRLNFDLNGDSPFSPQLALFAETEAQSRSLGSRRFAYQPRLEFQDADGYHELQLRDWGCYEFMRKHGDARRWELRDALRLDNCPALLVGNLANQRTAWLIISVLRPITQPDLFPMTPSSK